MENFQIRIVLSKCNELFTTIGTDQHVCLPIRKCRFLLLMKYQQRRIQDFRMGGHIPSVLTLYLPLPLSFPSLPFPSLPSLPFLIPPPSLPSPPLVNEGSGVLPRKIFRHITRFLVSFSAFRTWNTVKKKQKNTDFSASLLLFITLLTLYCTV